METIREYLGADHKRCDDLFVRAETSASQRQWQEAIEYFQDFHDGLERHLQMEETILFPEFERITGNAAGPTGMMRIEHQQMRLVTERMSYALGRRDEDDFLGHAETLNILMQQHNLKEENILYPMIDKVLQQGRAELLDAMGNLQATH